MSRIDINELYLDSLDEINENERGQLGVPLFNRLANKAIRQTVDILTGKVSEYDEQGRTTKELGKTQKLQDLLFPLVRRAIQPITAGIVTYPQDYEYFIDLRGTGSVRPLADCLKQPTLDIDRVLNGGYGFQQVDVLAHDKIGNRINSNIPSLRKKPCAEQLADGFQLYPYTDRGSCFLLYLKEPAPVKLVQTLDPVKMVLVYDPVNSLQPEMHRKLQKDLSRRIALYFMSMTREERAAEMTTAVERAE